LIGVKKTISKSLLLVVIYDVEDPEIAAENEQV